MIKIGTKLFTSPPGQSEKWTQGIAVIGETKLSWLVGSLGNPYKVNKKTMEEAIRDRAPRRWYTEAQMLDAQWIKKYRHQISGAVLSEKDICTLQQIVELLGMELK